MVCDRCWTNERWTQFASNAYYKFVSFLFVSILHFFPFAHIIHILGVASCGFRCIFSFFSFFFSVFIFVATICCLDIFYRIDLQVRIDSICVHVRSLAHANIHTSTHTHIRNSASGGSLHLSGCKGIDQYCLTGNFVFVCAVLTIRAWKANSKKFKLNIFIAAKKKKKKKIL